ncbi:MAG TPA: DUF1311 domain-containing protein [Ottowia sp.]|uniref:lysozyme inhibitor LprI family protein n=1 Tax=Ottowia sp. TaxID=1898956 RepID=UPI002C6EDAEF|nr:lysozyme inhibitor LprI family protein [Ottowia sp.]HMN20706.1 DUF1311 domain-containing protein [Ottowia sp.]
MTWTLPRVARWGALLVLAGTIGAARGAPLAPPEPGFRCAEARSVAERLVCARRLLALADGQLAQLYRQAQQAAPERDALRTEQLAWLKRRDSACIGQRTLAQAEADSRVHACLLDTYVARRRALRDIVQPPLLPSGLMALPDAARRQIALDRRGCAATQGRLSGDGRVLALEVGCEAPRPGRRIWLLQPRGAQEFDVQAGTPELGASDPHGEQVVGTGTELLWDRDQLYIFSSMEAPGSAASGAVHWAPVTFVASMANGPARLATVPERLTVLLELQRQVGRGIGDAAPADEDPDLVGGSPVALARQLFWLSDAARGTISLATQAQGQRTSRILAMGSWELARLAWDARRLIYPGGAEGLLLLDTDTGITRRIAGTGAGDVPLAWQPDARRLAWLSPRPCGGLPASAGSHVCVATLTELGR